MLEKKFISTIGTLLTMAKPHLKISDYTENESGQYFTITCDNGAAYKVDVTADSKMAMVTDVFSAMAHK